MARQRDEEKLSPEQCAAYDRRLVEIGSRVEWLAKEFLDHYAQHCAGAGVGAAFEEWQALTFDPPLREIEARLILGAVTHAASGKKIGKRRVALDREPGTQFLGLREERALPTDDELERVAAGDLAPREGEGVFETIHRIAVGLKYLEDDEPKPPPAQWTAGARGTTTDTAGGPAPGDDRVSGPDQPGQSRRTIEPAEPAWLPYKDPDDDLGDLYVDIPPEEPAPPPEPPAAELPQPPAAPAHRPAPVARPAPAPKKPALPDPDW
jgi:hypothetical protein